MEVEPDEVVRMITRIIGVNDTMYANTFYAQNRETVGISDDDVQQNFQDWANALFGALNGKIDSQNAWGSCQLDVVEVTGVYNSNPELNTAKVTVVRPIGFIAPTVTFGAAGEEYTGIATMSIIPQTNVARARARKSLSGFTEAYYTQGVVDNALLTSGVLFGLRWVQGPSGLAEVTFEWGAGTLSLRLGVFAGFTGTYTVNAIPGTMITRKIGRGA